MLIKYVDKKFGSSAMSIIDTANEIIADYSEQGFDLTLRQLYYQFVARDLIPNQQKEYKRLGSIINDARLAGLVSWEAIVDRTRNLEKNSHWRSPKEIVQSCAAQYQIDKWEGMLHYVEVWIEKDALAGVIEKVCREYDVPYFSCRGYTSQSEMWSAGQRLRSKLINEGFNEVSIIHLGDHDPSGIDMSRDIQDRLRMFVGDKVEMNRIALNMDQITQYRPPPNPCKITDSRAEGYIKKFGRESWELDALDPRTIHSLIEKKILEYRNEKIWKQNLAEENAHKKLLLKAARGME